MVKTYMASHRDVEGIHLHSLADLVDIYEKNIGAKPIIFHDSTRHEFCFFFSGVILSAPDLNLGDFDKACAMVKAGFINSIEYKQFLEGNFDNKAQFDNAKAKGISTKAEFTEFIKKQKEPPSPPYVRTQAEKNSDK